MRVIKFKGISKTSSVKKAISFFYDNFDDDEDLKDLLNRCRLQKDGTTVHYYHEGIIGSIDETKKANAGHRRGNRGFLHWLRRIFK